MTNRRALFLAPVVLLLLGGPAVAQDATPAINPSPCTIRYGKYCYTPDIIDGPVIVYLDEQRETAAGSSAKGVVAVYDGSGWTLQTFDGAVPEGSAYVTAAPGDVLLPGEAHRPALEGNDAKDR